MRLFVLTLLLAIYTLPVAAQHPQEEVDLTQMTFIRQSFVRNFYNLRKVVSQINMEGTDLMLPNSANLIVESKNEAPTLTQIGCTLEISSNSGTESTIRIGAFHPYLCYEAEFSDLSNNTDAGIIFYPNNGEGRSISVVYRKGEILAIANNSGEDNILGRKQIGSTENLHIRVQYTGVRFHIFHLRDNGNADLLYSVENDMRSVESCITHSYGIYTKLPAGESVTLCKAESALTCGTGQADPQIIQNVDGTPLIRDGKLYLCMTTRGFERIFDSYQGVYSLDLASYELHLEGALFFGKEDGLMYGFHATKVVYNPSTEEFLVMTTTHEDTHTLAYSSTKADLLHGLHFLECKELDFPHNYTRGHGYNTEDPDFFYDSEAGKWRLAYCALKDKSYVTYLCESDSWDGPYLQIAESVQNNNTGIRITSVGGRRYVLSGGSNTTFYIYDYPTLRYEGTFRQQYANGGFRGWPTIVPIPYGKYERYLWITFDRGAQTGKYSYGTLYFYLGDKMWRKE